MMRTAVLLLLPLLWCVGATAGLSSSATAAEASQFDGVRVGLGDCYQVGLWTPVTVTIHGGSSPLLGQVTLTVLDGSGIASGVSSDRPCQVLPGAQTSVTLYARFGRESSRLRASLVVAGRVVADRTFESALEVSEGRYKSALDQSDLIVCVGRASAGAEAAVALHNKNATRRPTVARLTGVEQLPTRWYGYEGVDTVMLCTGHPEIYRQLGSDGAQVQALDQWVRNGGKLVLSVGVGADEVLHAAGPLARFAPGKFTGMVALRQAAALESYAGSHASLTGTLRCARLTGIEGMVEAREADLPLVIRRPYGFGQVIFVAADLDLPPLAAWNDRPSLVARLLDQPEAHDEQADENGYGMHQGYDDLAGQLRSSLDQFAGVRLVPFWLVALLAIGYILLIGPGDYFFLRKVVRRMHWTWFTFPTVVLAVYVGAYVLAYRLKGSQLRINEIHVVDVDGASGRVRGTAWMNVFSPRMESFALSFAPRLPDGGAAAEAQPLLAWLGLPGPGFGGMNPQAPGLGLGDAEYWFSPSLDAMHGVPIQMWSTKSFTSRWSVPAAPACLQAELTDDDRLPVGRITNRLDLPLRQCMLAYDRWAYELGTLAPGQSVEIGPNTRRSELSTLLTGRKFIFDEKDKLHQEATPYDQASVDPNYILRAMMFFQAAGGQRYTGLANRYQAFIDLSGLLKAQRAILVAEPDGKSETPLGGDLLRDGRAVRGPQDHHTVVYRFVLPVKSRS